MTRSEGPKIALVQEGEEVIQILVEQGWNQADRELTFEAKRVVTLIDDDMRALATAGYELIIDGTFDAVCSLFTDDAVVIDFLGEPGWDFEGNTVIAESVSPLDDDRAFGQVVITDIALVEGAVVWPPEFEYLGDVSSTTGNRAVVEDGKIILWEYGSKG